MISLQGRKVGSKVVLNSEERRPLQPVSVTEERGESDWPVLHLHHQIFWDVGVVRREEGGGRCGGCYLEHARQRPDRLGLAFTSNLLVVTWSSHCQGLSSSRTEPHYIITVDNIHCELLGENCSKLCCNNYILFSCPAELS